tara:strand:+ start:1660 stop:2511 length:852 start_codon:yes stop_codon:yes gene_type:complete
MKKKLLRLSLVGRTNAGKSTLLNNLIGEIVSIQNKKINTTQEFIIGVKNYNNYQYIFYDTPGLNLLKSKDKNNKFLKQSLWNAIDDSEIIIFVIDSKNIRISYLKNELLNLKKLNKKILILFNKVDLISKKILLPIIKKIDIELKLDVYFTISAKFKYGFEDFLNYLKKYAKESKWAFNQNQISNKDDIFITNECTRNSMLTFLHKEIPYNIKIKNIYFNYLKNGDLKIKQNIIIKEKRYKKIILGKRGEKIKKIREFSQKQINKIFDLKVHLYLEIINDNGK